MPETTSNLATKSRQVSTVNCQETIFMSDLLYVVVDCVVPKEEVGVVVEGEVDVATGVIVEETVVEVDVEDEVVTDVVEDEHKVGRGIHSP